SRRTLRIAARTSGARTPRASIWCATISSRSRSASVGSVMAPCARAARRSAQHMPAATALELAAQDARVAEEREHLAHRELPRHAGAAAARAVERLADVDGGAAPAEPVAGAEPQPAPHAAHRVAERERGVAVVDPADVEERGRAEVDRQQLEAGVE